MNLLLVLLLNLSGGDVDVSEWEKVAIQDDGRIKPFDTFARECLRRWSGSQTFHSFKKPGSGDRVEVFSDGNATSSLLELLSDPDSASAKRLLKIQHPELKKKLGFETWKQYYSMDELQLRSETLRSLYDKAAGKPSSDRDPLDRAVLSLANGISLFEQVVQGVPLRIIPLSYGRMERWVSIFELNNFLEGGQDWLVRTAEYAQRFKAGGQDFQYRQAMSMVDDVRECIEVLAAHPLPALQKIHDEFNAMMGAFDQGDSDAFAGYARELGTQLRALDPAVYPAAERLGKEVDYNRLRPFRWSAALYGFTFLVFLFSIIFNSRVLWGGGLLSLVGAIGLHGYAYMWRWDIADRFPLSNQYEAMLALALLGAVVALLFELALRSKYLGLCAGLLGTMLILLADSVTEFSPFIRPLPPALQSIWMTIHVPTVLTGYVCGALMAILGHIFLLTYMFAPGKKETLQKLETYQYRILQVTVLFLLAGIILGGIWAKEAWGRFWGWDMKETWALITLLCYLAILHMRMARAIRGFGLSIASIIGVCFVFLTFYGVNYVFGKGLHTYGFGEGSQTAMFAFFVLEGMIIAAAMMIHLVNRAKPVEGPKG
jgi:cytochrome c-type biogenesis protein CcsB